MASIEKSESSTAAGLSLAAGIIILVGGAVLSFWHMSFLPQMGWMMGSQFASGVVVTSMIGLVFGGIVIVGAILMYKQPLQTRQWGMLVLIFSVLSFIGMGGFVIGGIFGIVGGILAILKKR